MAFVKLADNYTDLIGKFAVALLAEGVDRNWFSRISRVALWMSPSSRRAWIEIQILKFSWIKPRMSPSSRRAWIEIQAPVTSS